MVSAVLRFGEHEVLDLDDRGHCIRRCRRTQAHQARVRRHAVHDPARRGDQAVAAFCNAGQAGEKLVGDVLPAPSFAEHAAGECRAARSTPASCRRRRSGSRSCRPHVVILPRLWFRRTTRAIWPAASPCARRRGCRAPCPQHGLLPPAFCDICRRWDKTAEVGSPTANTSPAAFGRSATRSPGDAARPQGGHGLDERRQRDRASHADSRSSFCVDHPRTSGDSGMAPPVEAGRCRRRDDGR